MSTTLVLRDATLWDGTGADPVESATVTVADGKIAEITTSAATPPDDALVIDCGGRFLIPGLIDAHAHVVAVEYGLSHPVGNVDASLGVLMIAQRMEAMLQLGITTVRDAGGADRGLKEAVRQGYIRGPRMLISNKALSQTGGHGDHRPRIGREQLPDPVDVSHVIADGVDEVRRAAREQFRMGADQIKIMAGGGALSGDRLLSSQYSVAELAAVVEEADAVFATVMAHALSPRAIDNCIAAGVHSIEHGNFLTEQNAKDMAANNVYLVPTVMVYENAAARWQELGFSPEIAEKMRLGADAGRTALETAQRAGVQIGFGGDLLGRYFDQIGRGLAIQAEVMGARAALTAATRTNANLIGLGDQIGTVQPGKLADLLVVDGDPLRQPQLFTDPANIMLVLKDGNVYRDTLNPNRH
jgi:imidazolonepropionase-like amidohydrolase